MKQAAELAIEEHLGELYDAEEVPTSVDVITGKVEEEGGGMPIKEYWEKWKAREAMWIHEVILPSITLDANGGEICSFNKRKPCKVRSRISYDVCDKVLALDRNITLLSTGPIIIDYVRDTKNNELAAGEWKEDKFRDTN